MRKIKTKSMARNVRTLDKATAFTHRAKDAYVRTKEQVEYSPKQEDGSPVQYAEGKVQHVAEGVARRTGSEMRHMGEASIQMLRRGIRQKPNSTGQGRQDGASVRDRDKAAGQQQARAQQPRRAYSSEQAQSDGPSAASVEPVHSSARGFSTHSNTRGRMSVQASGVRPVGSSHTSLAKERFVQSRHRQVVVGKRTIKTPYRGAAKLPKRSAKAAKITIKTSRVVAKTTVKAAGATANASKRAVQIARAAAKAAAVTVKTAAKAVVTAGKAIAAAIKGLIALISVGGWVTIVVILVLCLVGFLVSSPFGLFFSSENKDEDVSPLSEVVQAANADFNAKIQGIISAHPEADRVEIAYLGSADNIKVDNWIDIAAVFAVKTVMAENGMDVATIDATRVEIIQEIFWDMNRIDFYLETIEHTETVTVTKPDGTKEEKTETTYEYILHINITSKTAEQQASDYAFTEDQTSVMEEMLSGQFRPLMLVLLGIDASTGLSPEQLEELYHDLPIGEEGAEIVRLALSRLGDPYSQPKAGQGDYTDCSYFARWCYQQIGVSLPRTAAAQAEYCVNNGLTIGSNDLAPGDLVFFSHEANGRFMNITHVAIYAGNGYIVDASSSRGQVVYREMIGGDVIYGRPYL